MTTAAQIAGSNSIIAPMLQVPRPVFVVQHEINRADLAEGEQEELIVACAYGWETKSYLALCYYFAAL